jgi:hypothetical protein
VEKHKRGKAEKRENGKEKAERGKVESGKSGKWKMKKRKRTRMKILRLCNYNFLEFIWVILIPLCHAPPCVMY